VFTSVSDLTGAKPVHLIAVFRQHLAALRLEYPVPVPGSAPEGDLVDVIGSEMLSAEVFSLLQAAKPTHAYVVHGVLMQRPESPKHCVTVPVVRWPEQGSPPATLHAIDSTAAVIS